MKQFLEHSTNNNVHSDIVTSEELPEKGLAKSLLAKWKSMENVKDKDTSPEPKDSTKIIKDKSRAISKDRQTSPTVSNGSNTNSDDCLPQSGTAKSLLNKWQNIDSNTSNQSRERKGPRPITPPPLDELQRNISDSQENLDSNQSKQSYQDEELALLKGRAKDTLAK